MKCLPLTLQNNNTRQSGIELLKLLAIILIVLFHITKDSSDHVLDLATAPLCFQTICLIMLKQFGTLGNMVFFLSSAWFLLGKNNWSIKKPIRLFMDVWTISVFVLLVVLCLNKGNISKGYIIKSLLPIGNNWYVIAYIGFCFLYPFLNAIMQRTNGILKIVLCVILIMIWNLHIIPKDSLNILFFEWPAVFFFVGFLKEKHTQIFSKTRIGVLLAVAGGAAYFLNAFLLTRGPAGGLTQAVELIFSALSDVYVVILVLGLFIIFKNLKFKSVTINYLSSLSLMVYLFHDNFLFVRYYRRSLFDWVYEVYGYSQVLLWIIIFAAGIFIAAFLVSLLYKCSISKLLDRLCDRVYPKLDKMCKNALQKMKIIH